MAARPAAAELEPSLSETARQRTLEFVTYRLTPDEAYRASRMLDPARDPDRDRHRRGTITFICGAVLVAGDQAGLGIGLVVGALFLLAWRPLVRWLSMRRISARLDKVPEPIVVTVGPDGTSRCAWPVIESGELG